jgi:hypothetical protein
MQRKIKKKYLGKKETRGKKVKRKKDENFHDDKAKAKA